MAEVAARQAAQQQVLRPSAASSTQTITVGQNGLTFSPNSVVVAPGKSVVFQFYPGNHSLVEGSFDKPCQPLSSTSFYSGFVDSSSGPAVSLLFSNTPGEMIFTVS